MNEQTRINAQFGAVKSLVELNAHDVEIMHKRISKFIVRRHYQPAVKKEIKMIEHRTTFMYTSVLSAVSVKSTFEEMGDFACITRLLSGKWCVTLVRLTFND